jgi:hypothetical protein
VEKPASHRPAFTGSPPSGEALQVDVAAVLGDGMAASLAESLAGPAAVVNDQRQVVFANRRFLSFARAGVLQDIVGRRLGALLGIASVPGNSTLASRHPPGSTPAVTDALAGRVSTSLASLTLGGDETSVSWQISALPLRLRGRTFALVQFSPGGESA